MDKYILCKFENGKERMIMTCADLELTRKQGEALSEGYVIYETKMIEYGTPISGK